MNGDRFKINDLSAEIDKRLSDPFWDKRMARSVIRNESYKRNVVGIASAASLVLIFSGVFFYQYQQLSNPTYITETEMGPDKTQISNEMQSSVIDVDQFPFSEEKELSMLSLEELYGE